MPPPGPRLDRPPVDAPPPSVDPAPRSFEAVFAAEFEPVVRLAYAMTRSDERARDAAQEAFVRLLERWGSIRNPEGFVRAVAINRVRDHERHRRVRERVLPRLVEREPLTDEVDELADALAELPARRRAMVVLRFYEQRTVPEIAAILGVRPGTVSSGLARSMDTLRRSLT